MVSNKLLTIPLKPSGAATLSMEEIASYKQEGQVLFQQVYLDTNDTKTQDIFDRAKALGTKAFAFTVDSAADGNRQRGARYGVPSAYVECSIPSIIT